jgi:hypothetical protein
MRPIVAIVSWVVLPIAVVVVAYKCAIDFVEDAVINIKRRNK